ncbi:MAG: mannitol dehydrogenase family protein, partial [Pseudomonadota bacterium]
MVEALRRRRAAGCAPFTCLSCDNLQGNGAALRRTVVALARMSDEGLAHWVEAECGFPNSMVDCIAPSSGEAEIALARSFGVRDAAPVTHEAFRQWVIEDDFSAGRPPLEDVGVIFSADVHAYETMKIRILNAGHQVLANAGEVLGAETIADCMAHPAIAALFERVEREEIAPTVAPVPGMTPLDYVDLIKTRFANPRIIDTTRRVAFDGSARHPGFLHPIIRDQIAAGRSVSGLALVEALWARMCEGRREDGSVIEPNDPHWADLAKAAAASRDDPLVWLRQSRIYGDLADASAFAQAFSEWRAMIAAAGARTAILAYGGLGGR